VSFDVSTWVTEYRNQNPNEAIPYDDSGTRKTDCYEFALISAHFQQRGHIRRDEFREIAEWKSPRQKSRYKNNRQTDVELVTSTAINSHLNVEHQVSALCELDGVGVPVASAILTVVFPQDYGVLDYRAWRAAEWFDQGTVSFSSYGGYADFLDDLRNYATTEAYKSYLDNIRTIANSQGVSAREVDMALWAYDESH
jgi:hypothetical protein